MKLNLYFDQDKIMGDGGLILPMEDDIPVYVYSGVDIVREYDNTHYEITPNIYFENRIFEIYRGSDRGSRSKIYKLIGSREPVVYDLLIARLNTKKIRPITDNYSLLWKQIMNQGVYKETCVSKTDILDMAVYNGILEYDNNGYYSIAYDFVEKIKQKKTYPINKAMETIKCLDKELTISVYELFGYRWKSGKMVLNNTLTNNYIY